MTTVDTPMYQSDDSRLKLEYISLLEEVAENSRKIREIQVRDMQTVELMKYHLNRKRELNERMRHLKNQLVERHLERQGSMVKMDEWISGLKISTSPLHSKSPEDTGLNQFYSNDAQIGNTDAVDQSTDDLLAQLSSKIERLTKSVNSSMQSDSPAGGTPSRENSGTAQQPDGNLQKSDNQTTFLFQYLKKETSPKLSPAPEQQSTTRKRSGQSRLNYPANVELKSIKSPPVLPHKRKTYTTFTTKHSLCRKQQSPMKTSVKHKHVGDYMVHCRNPVVPTLNPLACGTSPGSQTKFCGFVWTVAIILLMTALFYMYPSLLNAVLLLKEGTEHARDEVTRILDSIVVRAGGDSWLSRTESEMSSSYTTASPAPTPSPSFCSWSSSSTESATESEESTWQTILGYAKAVYRYVLYD